MEPRIIDYIESPQDLHALTNDELELVAHEVREQIVSSASLHGGHVASSLGAVELIIACHAELNCPHDKIVFDVGHQAYAHKILTGRLDRFDTLRTSGGLSGFTSPEESPYDAHWSGHASDALSVALGLARARDLEGGDQHIVAVVGDASISGGMSFEALNQIGQDRERMVIVLNDNGMAISHNVGALARHLSELRASNDYRTRRDALLGTLKKAGPIGRIGVALAESTRNTLKSLLLPGVTTIFEQLGITCLAPVNGHNIAAIRRALRRALASSGPVLVHVVTTKGHGYGPAEEHPKRFHGVGPFDTTTGEVPEKAFLYSDAMVEALMRETANGADTFAITAAMADGTGLIPFRETYPSRYADVGICEEHAVGLAAGLAAGGKRPVFAIYSTFLQRALDQVIIDVALPKLNVILCVDRAGIVGADGATHNGSFDLVYLRMIPNMHIICPSSANELASALHTALALGGPFAIRYPREACEPLAEDLELEIMELGKSQTVRTGDDLAILAFGNMVTPALKAAEALSEQGIEARVVNMRWAKPIDLDAVRSAAETKLVVTLEDGCLLGGVGEAVATEVARLGTKTPVLTLGIPDQFVPHGSISEIHHELGLDAAGIVASINEQLERPAAS